MPNCFSSWTHSIPRYIVMNLITSVFIESLNNNAGKRLVQGLDVTAVYQLPTTNFGQFTFTLGWNHFFTWKAEPIAGFGHA